MKLVPARPPGRSTRRAGAYAWQIQRLRTEGYTFDAIREALATAGVVVSISTVQREAGRPLVPPVTGSPAASASASGGEEMPPQEPPPAPVQRSGREIAEEFFRLNPSNPLLKSKDPP